MNHMKRKLIFVLLAFLLAFPGVLPAQQAKVNRKKIEREKRKREKEGMKEYQAALKRHMKNQSKETRVMMRQSKKGSKQATPVKRK